MISVWIQFFLRPASSQKELLALLSPFFFFKFIRIVSKLSILSDLNLFTCTQQRRECL